MAAQVTWRGNAAELIGPELKVGDKAPDGFTVSANDMSAVKGSELSGKARIILSSPSVDTAVCDVEGRRFNEEAAKLPNVALYFVTVDLPFAQKRWCGAAGIERVKMFSDYKDRSFGTAYGVFNPQRALLARAVFVVGPDDKIRHVEYVKEVTTEPNYGAALEAARALT